MAKRVLQVVGKPETLRTYVQDPPDHDQRYTLNCKNRGNEHAWKPTIPLEEGLQKTIE
jgi:dTDP-glucose 4,6-dehydratase